MANLLRVWASIWSKLATEISDPPQFLPSPGSVRTLAGLKRYEDALDTLVSAWMVAKFLEARARPYGDRTAAIWVPFAG